MKSTQPNQPLQDVKILDISTDVQDKTGISRVNMPNRFQVTPTPDISTLCGL